MIPVTCEVCRTRGEARAAHIMVNHLMILWVKPPLGWWVHIGPGPISVRCAACMKMQSDETERSDG